MTTPETPAAPTRTDSSVRDMSILDAIGNARVQFWVCPIRHPREPLREQVRWSGKVATCCDCGMTNEPTDLNVAHLAAAQELRGKGGSTLRHLLSVGLAAATNGSSEARQ